MTIIILGILNLIQFLSNTNFRKHHVLIIVCNEEYIPKQMGQLDIILITTPRHQKNFYIDYRPITS
jgi:hypothetical protein